MKHTALLIILTFYLVSCNHPGHKTDKAVGSDLPYHIDLTQSQSRDIFLSDFADDISYIRLKSDGPLVGGFCNLFIGPDQFIINDFGQELMVFAKDGGFMNKIGHRGAGPGEYRYTNNFMFDEENGRYCLSRDTTNEIKVFNLAGKYQKTLRFQEYPERMQILVSGSKFYVSGSTLVPKEKYTPVIIYNNDGTKWKEYTFSLPDLKEDPQTTPYGMFALTSSGQVILNNFSRDTSYLITKNGEWTPYLVFNRGPNPMPFEERFFYGRYSLYKNQNYDAGNIRDLGPVFIFNNTVPPDKTLPSIFFKHSRELVEIKNFVMPDGKGPVGIPNDLDGGPILIWQFTCRDGYVYCLWQAIDLIQAKEAGDFDRIEPKYPEKKKQLLQMIDSLKPNDNPVIMRVKIKDI